MTKALRIAIADDEPDMREFLQGALARLGHEVVVSAGTGRELVEGCRAAPPDLVITDIKMPDMDGLEAVGAITRQAPIPVIVISAYHDQRAIDRARQNHIAAYLVKPVKADGLAPAIAVVMHRSEEFRALEREASGLREALEDRKIIERAKGILMKQAKMDEPSAFRALQKLASQKSQKLAAVARTIIETADLLRPPGEEG